MIRLTVAPLHTGSDFALTNHVFHWKTKKFLSKNHFQCKGNYYVLKYRKLHFTLTSVPLISMLTLSATSSLFNTSNLLHTTTHSLNLFPIISERLYLRYSHIG
uniref:Ovule protein n=1 Tax=Heterorhabditis bacteriophora TaxID=37862 RepID=A0A1I7WFM3_HETBA